MKREDCKAQEIKYDDANNESAKNRIINLYDIRKHCLHNMDTMCLDNFSGHWIIYTYNGGGILRIGTDRILLEEQSVICLSGSSEYDLICQDRSWEVLLFKIGGALMECYESYFLSDIQPYKIPLSSSIPHILELLQELYAQDNTASLQGTAILTAKYLTDILTELTLFKISGSKSFPKVPSYISEMKIMFDTEYNKDYSLEQLEAHFSISKYRLCREFSKYCEISPLQYLNQVRINAAKELLLTSNLLVHEVGTYVGIENTNHFINLFKKYTGVTPLAFKHIFQVTPVCLEM